MTDPTAQDRELLAFLDEAMPRAAARIRELLAKNARLLDPVTLHDLRAKLSAAVPVTGTVDEEAYRKWMDAETAAGRVVTGMGLWRAALRHARGGKL